MAIKIEILFVEYINGVDELVACEDVTTNKFDKENVHLKLGSLLKKKGLTTCYISLSYILKTTQPSFNLLGFLCCE